MKPIKLTMAYFGPYIQETLDFSPLWDKIFLISGPTGSGKTTIFDAICFALYKEAGAGDRQVRELKSDFAKNDELSFVTFTFSVGHNTYKIHRIPEQTRRSKRGDKSTKQSHEVSLYSVMEGEEILISSSIDGCNQKIQEIIGLSLNQFRQIVLLPQGEFSKLLKANRSEREALLKTLFKIDFYPRFTSKMEEKKQNAQGITDALHQTLETQKQHLLAPEGSKLSDHLVSQDLTTESLLLEVNKQIEQDGTALLSIQKTATELEGSIQEINRTLGLAEAINQRFVAWEDAKQESLILQSNLDEILQLDKTNQSIALAHQLIPKEQSCQESKTNHQITLEKKQVVESELRQIDKEFSAINSQLQEVNSPSYDEQIQTHLQNIIQFKSLSNSLSQIQNEQADLNQMIKAFEKLEKEIALGQEKQKQLETYEKKIHQLKESTQIEKNNQLNIKETGTSIRENLLALTQLESLYLKKSKQEQQIKTSDQELLTIKTHLHHWERQKEELEALERKNQAGHLAQTLTPNSPCPVCGSLHHPAPANTSIIDTKEAEFKTLTKQIQSHQTQLASIKGTITSLTKELIEINQSISRHPNHPSHLDLTQVQSAIQSANKQRQELLNQYDSAQQKISTLIQLTQDNEAIYTQLQKDLETTKTLQSNYEQAKQTIDIKQGAVQGHWTSIDQNNLPIDISLETISQEIINYFVQLAQDEETFSQKLKNKKESIQQSHQDLMQKKEKNLGIQLELTNQAQTHSLDLQRKTEVFHNALNQSQMSLEAYHQYKIISEHILEVQRKKVEDYRRLSSINQQQLVDFEKELSHKTPMNLDDLKQKRKNLIEQQSIAQNSIQSINSRLQTNQDTANRMKTTHAELAHQTHQLEILLELNQTIKGQVSGKPKMKLESYVLTAYLQDILHHANLYLKDSSQGRYTLVLKEELTGGRDHGLEIQVDDLYTGKTRSATSLSGGETFISALAMAMGLSDIICQGVGGGLALDTLFVDEGFATLDKDSLNLAMDCLEKIHQGGRTMGIISHVEELKERLDCQIQVVKTTSGSRFFVVGS